ncbi:MAG TPA: VWA domain-containing protein [Pyrinomonadaceae bacterium]|nr:VWA domain-containing protein [Pyrinomonadaceae bacterium]
MLRLYSGSFVLVLLLGIFTSGFAQQRSRPSPSPSPTPPADEQEPVKVFTEEVRLPVIALDQYGHYDPTLEVDDVLVLEDGVAQQVRSVRHLPANVLLVLDVGGELSGLGGMSKRTTLTRSVALEVLNRLKEGTQFALMQFSNSVEVLQPWTTDKEIGRHKLMTKLYGGKRARFSDAAVEAARQLSDRPEGTRHVVFITDGVDTPGGKIDRAEAIKRLNAARATVHIISYTEFARQKKPDRPSSISVGQMPPASDPITATDPTLPPGTTRTPSFGVSIRFDPAMRRQRKAYEADLKKSQQVLTAIADETGGRIFLPKSSEQMIANAREAAREIGAEYVVTYRPRRPLSSARRGEYRRIEVASRRVGLSLRSRRGYVVPSEE